MKKYITNDDVGGGFPKMLDTYFHVSLARDFDLKEGTFTKRAYLELFNVLEKWLRELGKCVELFNSVGNNPEMSRLAEERIDERFKVLNERKAVYKLQQLQENF